MNKTEQEIASYIKEKFPKYSLEWVEPENGSPYLFVPGDSIDEIVKHLKETWEFNFESLVNLSAFDATEHIELTYHIYSYRHRHRFTLKIKAPRLNGEVNSIASVYGTANFQEREVFDLLGVKFKGHPSLTRIMMPDDWEGHPLLKDYQEKEEYEGIGTTREPLLATRGLF